MDRTQPTDPAGTTIRSPEGEGLVCRGLVKSYSGVTVLKSVDFTVRPGTVVGLIGENGAGKSTLSSLMTGVNRPDGGAMTLDGQAFAPSSPSEALSSGVVLIHQEIRLLPELSVAENIFLGRLPRAGGRINRQKMYADARQVLGSLGVDLDPRRSVRGLSMARQQEIEIAKALCRNPRYVIFDEPSASLGESETERVLERIRALRDQGTGVVYISHRLEEVLEVCDEVVCLRDGSRVADWSAEQVRAGGVTRQSLVNAMVGREFTYQHVAPQPSRAEVVIEVSGLGRTGVFAGIDFTVAAGEVFGIAGLVGAGRTEVVRAIAGVDRTDAGTVSVEGRSLKGGSPTEAIKRGIVMVPEDRKGQGLHLDRTAEENIVLPWEKTISRGGMVRRRNIRRVSEQQRERLDIRGRMNLPVKSMSGGNQQKVLIGKWLVHDPKVLIVDEPTRGVDVGAKMAIYEIIRGLAEQGIAVIVVSSELEEVLGLAHRVLVMAGGRQQGILSRDEATPERVIDLATRASGGSSDEPGEPALAGASPSLSSPSTPSRR